MDKKSKVILGLNHARVTTPIIGPNKHFTDSEKHQIIEEFFSIGCTKQEIWEKYTGQKEEHGQLLYWMKKLGYSDGIKDRRSKFGAMAKKKAITTESEESFETLQLKKRIAELELELKDAQMKAIAFSTMVDIAEREFNIPIRKKLNTKPSKK
jgi:transposase-like protein